MATIFIQDEETGTEVRIDNVDVAIERYDACCTDGESWWTFSNSRVPHRYMTRLKVSDFEGYQMAAPRRIGQHRKEVAG